MKRIVDLQRGKTFVGCCESNFDQRTMAIVDATNWPNAIVCTGKHHRFCVQVSSDMFESAGPL